MAKNAKIDRSQKAFLKAMKRKFSEDVAVTTPAFPQGIHIIPGYPDIHPTIIVGGDKGPEPRGERMFYGGR